MSKRKKVWIARSENNDISIFLKKPVLDCANNWFTPNIKNRQYIKDDMNFDFIKPGECICFKERKNND